MMKLKIISDGTDEGTRVVNEATGEVLHGVVEISFSMRRGEHREATIVLADVPFEVNVEAKNMYIESIVPNFKPDWDTKK